MRIWGSNTAMSESRCYRPRARQEPGGCESTPASGKNSLSALLTIDRSPEIWKRRTEPSNCGARHILEGRTQIHTICYLASPPMGPADLKERLKQPKRESRLIPTLQSSMRILRRAISLPTASPRQRARFNAPPTASWKYQVFSSSDTTSQCLRATRSRWTAQWVGRGASMKRNTAWLTPRLLLWLVPAAYRRPGGHRAGPWIY